MSVKKLLITSYSAIAIGIFFIPRSQALLGNACVQSSALRVHRMLSVFTSIFKQRLGTSKQVKPVSFEHLKIIIFQFIIHN